MNLSQIHRITINMLIAHLDHVASNGHITNNFPSNRTSSYAHCRFPGAGTPTATIVANTIFLEIRIICMPWAELIFYFTVVF